MKDGQALVGALVCQVSLLESGCRGLAAVSGEAPDPRAELPTSRQGYLQQPPAWAAQRDAACFPDLFHGGPTVLTPGALPLESTAALGKLASDSSCLFISPLSENSPALGEQARIGLSCLLPPNRR